MKDYVLSLIQQYGNPILLIGLVAEFLGMPFIPGEAMMAFMGYLSFQNGSYPALLKSISFATAGTFIGSTIAWLLAYRYGEKVLLKIGKPFHLSKIKLDKTRGSFEKHQNSSIIFSRYIPGVRHVIPYLSGLYQIEGKKYASLNILGSVLWSSSFLIFGSILGKKWQVLVTLAKSYSLILLLIILFIFLTMKFFGKHQKMIFSIALPLIIFINVSEDMIEKELTIFDDSIYHFLAKFIAEDLTTFMKFLSFLGSGYVLLTLALIGLFVLTRWRQYSFYGWMISVNLAASSVLNLAFKLAFHRTRPEILRLVDITGYSFPSGHAMVGLCFYGYLAYVFWRIMKSKWRGAVFCMLLFLVFAIGISRIYLGVHYASDVIGGFSAGLAWLALLIPVSEKIHQQRFIL